MSHISFAVWLIAIANILGSIFWAMQFRAQCKWRKADKAITEAQLETHRLNSRAIKAQIELFNAQTAAINAQKSVDNSSQDKLPFDA